MFELSAPSTIDISSMLFESTTERLLYVVQLASSFFSVCISFTKWAMTNLILGKINLRILTWGRHPVIRSLYSLTFVKAVVFILTKV